MKIWHGLAPAISIATQYLLFPDAALGAEADPAKDQTMDEVVVTGTRAPGRTAIDSPVPIDVLGHEDLRRSGAIPGEPGEVLDTLLPSAFMARDSNNDLADVVRTVQLRGLDPAHTLVLVNGKRRAQFDYSATAGAKGSGAKGFGSTEHNTAFGRQRHSPEWLLDLDVEYAFSDRVRAALGGNNILDNYPDRTVEGNSYFGNFPYDVVAPIDMNGAYYYARVTYDF